MGELTSEGLTLLKPSLFWVCLWNGISIILWPGTPRWRLPWECGVVVLAQLTAGCEIVWVKIFVTREKSSGQDMAWHKDEHCAGRCCLDGKGWGTKSRIPASCDPSHSTYFPAPSVTESPESESECLSLITTEKGKFSLRNIKRTKILEIFLLNGLQVNFDSFKRLSSFGCNWRSSSLMSPYLGGVETSPTPLYVLFSEEKQCHTEFLSDGCLPFLTCLVKGLFYLLQQQLQMVVDWDCSYSLDLAGLNLAQTIRYSAEPSSFYFCGDSQFHDVI